MSRWLAREQSIPPQTVGCQDGWSVEEKPTPVPISRTNAGWSEVDVIPMRSRPRKKTDNMQNSLSSWKKRQCSSTRGPAAMIPISGWYNHAIGIHNQCKTMVTRHSCARRKPAWQVDDVITQCEIEMWPWISLRPKKTRALAQQEINWLQRNKDSSTLRTKLDKNESSMPESP